MTEARTWPAQGGEMGAMIRVHDWAATPLGSASQWPVELRTLTDLLLAQAFPMILLWGPDLIQIYNDGYRELMGAKHPAGLGQPTRECWPEVWHINAPIYDRVRAGETITLADQLFPITRHGAPEQAWFTLSYSPARDANGIGGIFITVVETTQRIRQEAEVATHETRTRALLESIDEGFYYARTLCDDQGRCTDIFYLDENPAAVRLVGQSAKGRLLSDLGDYEPFWRDIFGKVARTGDAQRLERHSDADGRTYDFYAFKPPGAAPDEFAVLFRDTTERKRQDRALAQAARFASFRNQLADALRPLTDPAEIQGEAARLLGEELGASRVLYGEVEDGEHILVRKEYNRAGETRAGQYEVKDFRALEPYFRSGRNFVSGDLGADPRLDADEKAYMAGFPVSALAMVSLVKGGQLVACLGVHMVDPHEWMPDEIGVLEEAAERTWDAVERTRAENRMRESEERFRQFAEASSDVLWIADAEGTRLEYLSPAYEAIWGEPRDAVMADLSHWSRRVHPEDVVTAGQGIHRLRRGERYLQEYRVCRPDGEIRYIHDTGFPIVRDGQVVRLAGVAQDLSERRLAERALAESEGRLRTLVEGLPQLVWRAVDKGRWTWASPQWTRFTGQSDPASHGLGWLDMIHPDDRERAMAAWGRAHEAGGFEVDYRVRCDGGGYRWFHTRASPVRDASGAIIEWLGTSNDVDELLRLQRHQRVLLAELQHRVRNTLGVVRSIVRRTAGTAEDVEEMSAHLQGRLGAFSRVQAALTRGAEAGVDLNDLVGDELLAHAAREGEALTIRGPTVTLQPRAAEALSLAVHELTTNAVKYGALTAPDGRLCVRWSVGEREGRTWLDFEWKESGVTMPEGPSRRGFGLELLERSLPYEHDAVTRAEFRPTGFRFTLAMPLTPPATRH